MHEFDRDYALGFPNERARPDADSVVVVHQAPAQNSAVRLLAPTVAPFITASRERRRQRPSCRPSTSARGMVSTIGTVERPQMRCTNWRERTCTLSAARPAAIAKAH